MTIEARTVRVALVVAVVVLLVPLGADYAGSTGTQAQSDPTASPSETASPSQSSGYRATGDLVYVVDAAGPGQLTVVDRASGDVVFTTRAHELYHDVDPSPVGDSTVVYVASNIRGGAACPDHLEAPCAQDVVERLNYSTGERERLWTRYVAYNGSSNVHDVDRLSGDRFLVADIQYDQVVVVNTTTGATTWRWRAASEFPRSSGGKPDDWTHVNDVEVVGEDLYMVNLRNQDQVVFVHRERGLLENRTLGADDAHDVVFEPHNPDYIPRERGGPAVLIADSENNRVVEYQWTNGSWERTWLWTDERLQWPRDADRLPNNNTLITDTHGTRILEVTPNGTIVWQRAVPRGVYEAELLGTGDESAGGRSMARIRGGNATVDVSAVDGPLDRAQKAFLGLFPPLVLHGVLYVLPTWVSPLSGATLLLAGLVVALWGVGEGVRFASGWLGADGGDGAGDGADAE